MKAHAALADEFGATPWWHGGDSLEWEAEPDRSAQRNNVEQLRSWGYAAEWITPRHVQELEPEPLRRGGAKSDQYGHRLAGSSCYACVVFRDRCIWPVLRGV